MPGHMKLLWLPLTVLVYMSLATGFWLADGGNRDSIATEATSEETDDGTDAVPEGRPDSWYMTAASPVFLFSGMLYLYVRHMYRQYERY